MYKEVLRGKFEYEEEVLGEIGGVSGVVEEDGYGDKD